MNVNTGKIIDNEEYEALDAKSKKEHLPIPAETKLDSVHKLQKPISATDRRSALKALERRRRKNKQARKARKANRK